MVRTYDPRDVAVIVDGRIITGVADGTFVSAEKEEDQWEPYVGAQGEVARARNAHPIGTISVTVEHTSPSNAHLAQLAGSSRLFPARVVDRQNNNVSIGGSACWVQKPGSMEFGGEVSEIEWVIVVADYEQRVN